MEQEEYRGYTIEYEIDQDPSNPRKEFDHLATMLCWHDNYVLGDVNYNRHNENFEAEVKGILRDVERSGGVYTALYLYEHSGMTMAAGINALRYPFTDPWDAGQVGFIYVMGDDIRKEYKVQRISNKRKQEVYKLLIGEVEEYDTYLRGDIWGYQITSPEGDQDCDSLWGIFGYDAAVEYAHYAIDLILEAQEEVA